MHLIPPNPNLRLHHPMDCAILGLVLHHGHLPIQLLLQLPLLSPGPPPACQAIAKSPAIIQKKCVSQ